MSIYLTAWFILVVSLSEIMAATFKLTNGVCESYNESWISIEHCRLHAIRRDRTVGTFRMNLHYPASNIIAKYQVLKKANGYKPWVLGGTINACAFMIKRSNPVAKMFYKFIGNFSTINHTCPYVGHQEIKDFYLTADQVPLPMPTGDYALMITWLFSGRPQFATNIYFRYEEDLIKQTNI